MKYLNLPKFSLQDILTLLLRDGLRTEGVFRKAGNARALREIKAQLNDGMEVDLKNQSVFLLTDLVKVWHDFGQYDLSLMIYSNEV